jgi:hypothetical protein
VLASAFASAQAVLVSALLQSFGGVGFSICFSTGSVGSIGFSVGGIGFGVGGIGGVGGIASALAVLAAACWQCWLQHRFSVGGQIK